MCWLLSHISCFYNNNKHQLFIRYSQQTRLRNKLTTKVTITYNTPSTYYFTLTFLQKSNENPADFTRSIFLSFLKKDTQKSIKITLVLFLLNLKNRVDNCITFIFLFTTTNQMRVYSPFLVLALPPTPELHSLVVNFDLLLLFF